MTTDAAKQTEELQAAEAQLGKGAMDWWAPSTNTT